MKSRLHFNNRRSLWPTYPAFGARSSSVTLTDIRTAVFKWLRLPAPQQENLCRVNLTVLCSTRKQIKNTILILPIRPPRWQTGRTWLYKALYSFRPTVCVRVCLWFIMFKRLVGQACLRIMIWLGWPIFLVLSYVRLNRIFVISFNEWSRVASRESEIFLEENGNFNI